MRNLYWLGAALLVGGCGGGPQDQAAKACSDELAQKMTGKSYRLDTADMIATARSEADTVLIVSSVILDPGLPSESKQSFECKARLADGKAEVIALTFNW